MTRSHSNAATALGLSLILLYQFRFTSHGLEAGFTYDDLMNLYRAMAASWQDLWRDLVFFFRHSPQYRPAGAVFYRTLYDLFGMDPFPFRIAVQALLAINVGLAYLLAAQISGRREIGLIAALVYAYHDAFSVFYYNTGLIYDLLCFALYISALCYYVGIRKQGRGLTLLDAAVVAMLHILAVNAKEIAVTLPLALLLFEALTLRSSVLRAPNSVRATVAITSLVSAAFAFGRVLGRDGLGSVDAYRPELRWEVFVDRISYLVEHFFYQREESSATFAIVIVLALAAVFSRQITTRFGLLFTVAAMLPLSFIPQRGMDAACVAVLGLTMTLASIVVTSADRVTSHSVRRAILFPALLAAVWTWHGGRRSESDIQRSLEEGRFIGRLRAGMEPMCRFLPAGSKVLFVVDPTSDWGTTFLVKTACRDSSIDVNRQDKLPGAPNWGSYDLVMTFDGRHLKPLAIGRGID